MVGSAFAGTSGDGFGGSGDSAGPAAAELASLVIEIQEAHGLFLTERELFPAGARAEAELIDALNSLRDAASNASNDLLSGARSDLRRAIDCLERAEAFMRYGNIHNFSDAAEFFVRQHYLDFLGREPDPAGGDFWAGEVAACGADARCAEVRRVNVSAAFSLSIEFQETGFLAYRAHKAAFGDLPGKPVPLTREAMLADLQQLGRGVVVGEGDWREQLESNKRAYFDRLAASERFASLHPQSQSPGQFVDALNANAGGALSQAERDSLVAELSGGATTRAQALRAVAEDADLARAEFNRAFVLMQYFGYLRRDPDSGQDTDFAGYNFWLAQLDRFGGDYERAEMVRAFIESIEYRRRFGNP